MEKNNKLKICRWRSFLFILSVWLLAGCSQHTDTDNDIKQNAIGFSCTTDNAGITRADTTSIENMQYFRVSAIWNKGGSAGYVKLMDKQLVEKVDENTWQYSPILYWPGQDKLSFFAYTPAISNGIDTYSIDGASNTFTINYTVSTDHKKQEDFMVATDLDKTVGPARLEFKHALSFVQFKVGTKAESYQVKKIELVNLRSQGTLTGTSSVLWEWSAQATKTTYSVEMKYDPIVDSSGYTEVGSMLAVLPQTPDNDDFVIWVTYDMLSVDPPLKKKQSFYPKDLEFKMGKVYTLNLELDHSKL
ncbi:fimbrillin family protein [Bacteroides sp. 519]|uniref:fimbrillin family protein n=1 Tax=Bacteroides sp. 519 TaxID=2302937 RepID=UPI0013CFDB25|nr:fimbrillin family protein [Bacteroides sp. 519]NDV59145.1 fimbrillin family protein [Bacteroides sp. 519]